MQPSPPYLYNIPLQNPCGVCICNPEGQNSITKHMQMMLSQMPVHWIFWMQMQELLCRHQASCILQARGIANLHMMTSYNDTNKKA